MSVSCPKPFLLPKPVVQFLLGSCFLLWWDPNTATAFLNSCPPASSNLQNLLPALAQVLSLTLTSMPRSASSGPLSVPSWSLPGFSSLVFALLHPTPFRTSGPIALLRDMPSWKHRPPWEHCFCKIPSLVLITQSILLPLDWLSVPGNN